MNFWLNLKKPISILAPMYDVTDVVFRQIVADCARPDAFVTEFCHVEDRGYALDQRLLYWEPQSPVIAQIWGTKPEKFYDMARNLKSRGFAGIDLNFGCPERSVMRVGGCAALIGNEVLSGDIIRATIEGAGGLPVSVKTRAGNKKEQLDEWISFLLQFDLAAITLHARLAKDMSKKPADWDYISRAVALRNSFGKSTLIIGNGDILDKDVGESHCEKYGCDGYMIGRGIFKNLFAFGNKQARSNFLSLKTRLTLLKKHLLLFESTYKNKKNYNVLKKFFKIYINDFPGASNLRVRFMETSSISEALILLDNLY